MAVLDILIYPDERLKIVADPIDNVDEEIRQIAADMIETMYAQDGVGLAAPQVNIPLRMVTVDVSEERDSPQVLINPILREGKGETIYEEGCLSLPGIRAPVKRFEQVIVQATDLEGRSIELEAEELHAVCLQHEMDHLNGILFIDHLSRLKRNRIHQRLMKQIREKSDANNQK